MPGPLFRSGKKPPAAPIRAKVHSPLRSFAFSPGLDRLQDGSQPTFDFLRWAAAFLQLQEESVADVLRGSVCQLLCLVLVIGVSLVSNRAHSLNRQRVVSRKLLNVLTRESRPCAHV